MEVKLIVVGGKHAGQKVPVAGPKLFIGRAEDCHLRPGSDLISRHHAVILVEEGFVSVRDFGSKNGTFLNGERIKTERELKNGDRLKLGPLEFEVELAVGVGGKKKPKVHSVQEAAARTVETAGGGEEDLDIFDLLGDEAEATSTTPTADTQPVSTTLTTAGGADDVTEARRDLPEEESRGKAKKAKQKTKAGPGRFGQAKGPTSKDTESAADDMLRQFFSRR